MNDDLLHFICPHCSDIIQIDPKELNCRIFRHAVFKHNGQQLDPHAKKEECERVYQEKLIYGCGKPFKISKIDGTETISKCDYV